MHAPKDSYGNSQGATATEGLASVSSNVSEIRDDQEHHILGRIDSTLKH